MQLKFLFFDMAIVDLTFATTIDTIIISLSISISMSIIIIVNVS